MRIEATARPWEGGRPGRVLFVTEAVFLPHDNGSSSIYSSVADDLAGKGWTVFCLSFYRDPGQAGAPAVRQAYARRFKEFLLVPGWNRGGGPLGRLGMAWRELVRYATGNVFASHPFLPTRRRAVKRAVVDLVERNEIDAIYFHKPQTLLLMRPLLGLLPPLRMVVDLHDDFVARGAEYDQAYEGLFRALPFRCILRDHLPMYVRHRLGRTDAGRSRARELALLARCDDVFIASGAEYRRYAEFPQLRGKVRHRPWPLRAAPPPAPPARREATFDAGFVAADSVMNLDAVVHFRDAVLPAVLRAIPDFSVLLAGTQARKVGPLVDGSPNIRVWQELPDVGAFYAAVATALVPLRHGTGVSVKAIEALAHGCPMISTRAGVRGLGAEELGGGVVDVVDDAPAFAAAVIRRTLERRARPGGARQPAGRVVTEASVT